METLPLLSLSPRRRNGGCDGDDDTAMLRKITLMRMLSMINKLKEFNWEGASEGFTIVNAKQSIFGMDSKATGRRERNKLAARDSRDRKKLYVQLL